MQMNAVIAGVAATGRTVPIRNEPPASPPSSAPPAVVIVAMIADAVPATCGNGVMAAVLQFGVRPCAIGTTAAIASENTQKLGLPPLVNETASSASDATTPSTAIRRTSRSRPRCCTRRALFSELTASGTTAITPKNSGNHSPYP